MGGFGSNFHEDDDDGVGYDDIGGGHVNEIY